jgi:hypothetical protein
MKRLTELVSVHKPLEELLNVSCCSGWRYTHIPLGEKRDKITGAKLKAMGVKPYWPDFIFIGPHFTFLPSFRCVTAIAFLELKRKGRKLSKGQEEFKMWAISLGIPHCTADNLNDAIKFLKEMKIINIK